MINKCINIKIQKNSLIIFHRQETRGLVVAKKGVNLGAPKGVNLGAPKGVSQGVEEDKYIIICTKDLAESSAWGNGYCPTDSATGLIKPAYLISWSRFGNVARFKWSGNEWIRQ